VAFLHTPPRFVTLPSPGAPTMAVLLGQPLGRATRHAPPPSHRGFGARGEARGGSDAPACSQMVAAICGFGFRYRGVAEGRAAAVGQLCATGTTAPQAPARVAIPCTNNEVGWAALTQRWAFCIDPG